MSQAISNTSSLLYLYRIGRADWLSMIFDEIWIPSAVFDELKEGQRRGYDVPDPDSYNWLRVVNPNSTPSEWLSLDLGVGELAAMALAFENPARILLLDDMLARRTAKAAGLTVWGTRKVLLEAKQQGITATVEPYINLLSDSSMWVSEEIRQRILVLAGEISE